MQALQGEMTIARLARLEKEIENDWPALCSKIRYLDTRIDMILGVKAVEDSILSYLDGRQATKSQIVYATRLAMLTLEIQLGAVNVQRLLETMPLPFIASLIGVHEARDDWMRNEMVDETEYLTQFFIFLSMNQQTMYSLDVETQGLVNFVQCEADVPRYAQEAGLPEVAVEEIGQRVKDLIQIWVSHMEVDLALDKEDLALAEESAA
jgi:hypothetical protein